MRKFKGKQAVANAEAIQRIDELLREHVPDCEGLRIARILKDRRPSSKCTAHHIVLRLTKADDGHVPLTLADLRALNKEVNVDGEDSGDETLVDGSDISPLRVPIMTERTIINNSSRGQAVQVNAPVETDMYKGLNSLTIRDNVAEEQSLQVNYGIKHSSLSMLFELQGKAIAASQQRQVSTRRERSDR
jgi:hypothetical protein